MKIFLACWPERRQQEALNNRGYQRRLLSYVELKRRSVLRKVDAAGSVSAGLGMQSSGRLELMLDSGAFSAWSKGVVVTLDEYIAFAVKYSRSFDWIVNLDVIPGKPGRRASPAEVDRSAAIGWENYYELKRRLGPDEGAKLIHVYHDGEHKRWLTKILDEGGEYIGISPRNDRAPQPRRDWLESIKPHLTDDKGWPIRRFHAFGVTSSETLEQHPWLYSADSTSWVRVSRNGSCYIPFRDKSGRVRARIVAFSNEHPSARPPETITRYIPVRDSNGQVVPWTPVAVVNRLPAWQPDRKWLPPPHGQPDQRPRMVRVIDGIPTVSRMVVLRPEG